MTESTPDPAELDTQVPWGGVTDPTHHDPHNYRYLIHLDSGRALPGRTDLDGADQVWEYILDDPEKIATLPFIPASLVDQNHHVLYQGTASSHGLILEAPAVSILAASSRDMFSKPKTIDDLMAEYPVSTPEQLLAETNQTEWNEIAVSPEAAVVRAVFWVENQTGEEPTFDRETVKRVAEKHGLPFLELDLIKY